MSSEVEHYMAKAAAARADADALAAEVQDMAMQAISDIELAERLRLRRGPHRSMQDKIDQIAAADRIEELSAEVDRLRAAGTALRDAHYSNYGRTGAVRDWDAALGEES